MLAHLTNVDGSKKEQTLKQHCIKTAEYAGTSFKRKKFYYIRYLAGLLHDMGKATKLYNDYLEDAFQGKKVVRGSVNHTFAGVIWLFERYHQKTNSIDERLTCEIIGYAIGAHHGLFDCVDLNGENRFIYRLQKDKKEICYNEAVHNFFAEVITEKDVDEYFQTAVREVQEFVEIAKKVYKKSNKVFYQISMLSRLILSYVIYGDRRDTREFMTQRSEYNYLEKDWSICQNYFENKIKQFDDASELNQVRKNISQQCFDFAKRESGIYRLNVPTGAGKTLCTLRYALEHAKEHSKKRIIFIIPLLSVLEQNAEVIRQYLPVDEVILEHHSNVVQEKFCKIEQEKHREEELDQYELLSTSWEAPVIVSTLVQLLNILFDDSTSAIGRMQSLCDSVIIIDEIQSLPKKVIAMFNMTMNFLQQFCNTTIILSSATQPCLEKIDYPIQLADKPDMVILNSAQLNVFKRAEIINKVDPYGMNIEDCAAFCRDLIGQHSSLLVICNTKTDAKQLFKKIQLQKEIYNEDWCIIHLSTAMCQKHRMNTLEHIQNRLKEIQENLRKNKKIKKLICVSTQLVEAGVDFSFEGVVRILAGIDNLAQATGRCNRNNDYSKGGKVYLINLRNEKLNMLQEIRYAQSSTIKVIQKDILYAQESLIGELATGKFYKYLFEAIKGILKYPLKEGNNITDLLCNFNQMKWDDGQYILRQPFKTIGKEFKVFDEETIDILVPYGDGTELIRRLEELDKNSFKINELQEVMKQEKQYTVNLYQWQKDKLDKAGILYGLCDGRILVLKKMAYDEEYGVKDADEVSDEAFFL